MTKGCIGALVRRHSTSVLGIDRQEIACGTITEPDGRMRNGDREKLCATNTV